MGQKFWESSIRIKSLRLPSNFRIQEVDFSFRVDFPQSQFLDFYKFELNLNEKYTYNYRAIDGWCIYIKCSDKYNWGHDQGVCISRQELRWNTSA